MLPVVAGMELPFGETPFFVELQGSGIGRIDGQVAGCAEAAIHFGEQTLEQAGTDAEPTPRFVDHHLVHAQGSVAGWKCQDGPGDTRPVADDMDPGAVNPYAPDMLSVGDEFGVAVVQPGPPVQLGNFEEIATARVFENHGFECRSLFRVHDVRNELIISGLLQKAWQGRIIRPDSVEGGCAIRLPGNTV